VFIQKFAPLRVQALARFSLDRPSQNCCGNACAGDPRRAWGSLGRIDRRDRECVIRDRGRDSYLPALGSLIMAQWLGAGLSLSFAAATIENFGGLKALRRSWVLSRGRKWPIQLTWIAVFLSYYLLSYISQATPQWGWLYAWRAFHPNLSRGLYTAGYYALCEAPGSLLGPIFPIVATLFYYDQRIRKEGYDIERMMDAARLNESQAPVEALAGGSVSEGRRFRRG